MINHCSLMRSASLQHDAASYSHCDVQAAVMRSLYRHQLCTNS
jgi:hypothetical protein